MTSMPASGNRHVPVIVHHKAALEGQSAPPNTMEAIRASLEAGAQVIEIDVSALAAGDYLLVHDFTLDTETTGAGMVGECTVDRARELRLRAGHAGEPTAYHAALLSDVVQLFLAYTTTGISHGTRLQLDYKSVFPFPHDEPFERLLRLIAPIHERVIVSSVADWQLRRLRGLDPDIALGLDIQLYLDWQPPGESPAAQMIPRQPGIYGYWDDHLLAMQNVWTAPRYLADRCAVLLSLVPGVNAFYVNHHLLAQSLNDGFNWAAELHRLGIQLDAWTLDAGDPVAETHARQLRDAGVDQLTTNTPLGLAALLRT